MGSIPVTRCIFFFGSQYPETRTQWNKKNKNKNLDHPNLMKKKKPRTQWKKKGKKKHPDHPNPVEKKKKKKEEHTRPNPGKKKVDWSKGAAELWLVIPHVCLIKKMSLSYELWKLKKVKMYF